MIIKSSIFLVVCFFSTARSIKPNFYWRDYDGTIPSDALPGGNLNGNTTYIGMVSVPGDANSGTISGFIIPGDPNAYSSYGESAIKNDNGVRILCTTVPCRFVWTKKLEDDCVYVKGSYDSNRNAISSYIGRGTYEGNVVTGRVNFYYNLLYIGWLGSTFQKVDIADFEALAYC